MELSLANVRRCGAAFAGAIVEARSRLKQCGRRLRLRDVRPAVALVLSAAGVQELLGGETV